ncbi:MAG: nitronate monooxygenase [Dehalococcoidia bacterium]|jgi:NAD(P)H-dependent flavin oxidoreductase YrpB (nitropropane dioxygenase family)|nr:nitronate monooxygenase [Dehalococcoidia bacterium]
MGTRFVATVECDSSPEVKRRVLEAGDEDSVVTEVFTGKTTRVLRSPHLEGILRALEAGTPREEFWPQVVDLRRKKEARNPYFISIASGQGAGLVRGILMAEKVVRETIAGAEAICHKLSGMYAVTP